MSAATWLGDLDGSPLELEIVRAVFGEADRETRRPTEHRASLPALLAAYDRVLAHRGLCSVDDTRVYALVLAAVRLIDDQQNVLESSAVVSAPPAIARPPRSPSPPHIATPMPSSPTTPARDAAEAPWTPRTPRTPKSPAFDPASLHTAPVLNLHDLDTPVTHQRRRRHVEWRATSVRGQLFADEEEEEEKDDDTVAVASSSSSSSSSSFFEEPGATARARTAMLSHSFHLWLARVRRDGEAVRLLALTHSLRQWRTHTARVRLERHMFQRMYLRRLVESTFLQWSARLLELRRRRLRDVFVKWRALTRETRWRQQASVAVHQRRHHRIAARVAVRWFSCVVRARAHAEEALQFRRATLWRRWRARMQHSHRALETFTAHHSHLVLAQCLRLWHQLYFARVHYRTTVLREAWTVWSFSFALRTRVRDLSARATAFDSARMLTRVLTHWRTLHLLRTIKRRSLARAFQHWRTVTARQEAHLSAIAAHSRLSLALAQWRRTLSHTLRLAQQAQVHVQHRLVAHSWSVWRLRCDDRNESVESAERHWRHLRLVRLWRHWRDLTRIQQHTLATRRNLARRVLHQWSESAQSARGVRRAVQSKHFHAWLVLVQTRRAVRERGFVLVLQREQRLVAHAMAKWRERYVAVCEQRVCVDQVERASAQARLQRTFRDWRLLAALRRSQTVVRRGTLQRVFAQWRRSAQHRHTLALWEGASQYERLVAAFERWHSRWSLQQRARRLCEQSATVLVRGSAFWHWRVFVQKQQQSRQREHLADVAHLRLWFVRWRRERERSQCGRQVAHERSVRLMRQTFVRWRADVTLSDAHAHLLSLFTGSSHLLTLMRVWRQWSEAVRVECARRDELVRVSFCVWRDTVRAVTLRRFHLRVWQTECARKSLAHVLMRWRALYCARAGLKRHTMALAFHAWRAHTSEMEQVRSQTIQMRLVASSAATVVECAREVVLHWRQRSVSMAFCQWKWIVEESRSRQSAFVRAERAHEHTLVGRALAVWREALARKHDELAVVERVNRKRLWRVWRVWLNGAGWKRSVRLASVSQTVWLRDAQGSPSAVVRRAAVAAEQQTANDTLRLLHLWREYAQVRREKRVRVHKAGVLRLRLVFVRWQGHVAARRALEASVNNARGSLDASRLSRVFGVWVRECRERQATRRFVAQRNVRVTAALFHEWRVALGRTLAFRDALAHYTEKVTRVCLARHFEMWTRAQRVLHERRARETLASAFVFQQNVPSLFAVWREAWCESCRRRCVEGQVRALVQRALMRRMMLHWQLTLARERARQAVAGEHNWKRSVRHALHMWRSQAEMRACVRTCARQWRWEVSVRRVTRVRAHAILCASFRVWRAAYGAAQSEWEHDGTRVALIQSAWVLHRWRSAFQAKVRARHERALSVAVFERVRQIRLLRRVVMAWHERSALQKSLAHRGHLVVVARAVAIELSLFRLWRCRLAEVRVARFQRAQRQRLLASTVAQWQHQLQRVRTLTERSDAVWAANARWRLVSAFCVWLDNTAARRYTRAEALRNESERRVLQRRLVRHWHAWARARVARRTRTHYANGVYLLTLQRRALSVWRTALELKVNAD